MADNVTYNLAFQEKFIQFWTSWQVLQFDLELSLHNMYQDYEIKIENLWYSMCKGAFKNYVDKTR